MSELRRHKLPKDCAAVRHKFTIHGPSGPCEGYVHLGLYPEFPRRVGEVFIRLDRETERRYPGLSGIIDDWTIATSMSLQYGCEIDVIVDKHLHSQGIASGATENPAILQTSGLVAYATEYLRQRFCGDDESRLPLFGCHAQVRVLPAQSTLLDATVLGPLIAVGPKSPQGEVSACPDCGAPYPEGREGNCPACAAGEG